MPGNAYAVQLRIEITAGPAAAGQRKHDLRLGAQPGYVATTLSVTNRVVLVPLTAPELRRECERRRASRKTRRAMKSNAGVGVRGIVTFGHKAQPIFERLSAEAQDRAYREVAETAASRLGTTLTGLVVHCDESAPHAHFQLVGYCLDGTPVSTIAKRQTLRDVQTLAAEIMGRHAPGIERGFSKADRLRGSDSPADVAHRSVKELHADLPDEIAALAARIKALRSQLAALEEKARAEEERAAVARREAEALEDAIRRRAGLERRTARPSGAASPD